MEKYNVSYATMCRWAKKMKLHDMGKLIINIPDDILAKLDEKVKELSLPSRNFVITQLTLKYLNLPNLFDEAKE